MTLCVQKISLIGRNQSLAGFLAFIPALFRRFMSGLNFCDFKIGGVSLHLMNTSQFSRDDSNHIVFVSIPYLGGY